eukprot:344795-Prymnesium_polylepis.1
MKIAQKKGRWAALQNKVGATSRDRDTMAKLSTEVTKLEAQRYELQAQETAQAAQEEENQRQDEEKEQKRQAQAEATRAMSDAGAIMLVLTVMKLQSRFTNTSDKNDTVWEAAVWPAFMTAVQKGELPESDGRSSVSYTHLTLPTICSV